MIKFESIFTTTIDLLLGTVGIFIWHASVLFANLSSLFSSQEVSASHEVGAEQTAKTTSQVEILSLNEQSQDTASLNRGLYETIEETISRIKRDVHVTGAIISTPGQEVALFQIEGMPDRSFSINTQLMDGFIITGITDNRAILKNQTGNEIIFLDVGK